MEERSYEFAGLRITFRAPEELMFENEGRLGPFRVTGGAGGHVFDLELVDILPPPEGQWQVICPNYRVYHRDGVRIRYEGSVGASWENASFRSVHSDTNHVVQFPRDRISGRLSVHTVLGALNPEHLVVRSGGVILHAACVLHKGQAILFTAPSETGKSTQAELWRRHRDAAILNGDRVALGMGPDGPEAWGIPYAGSSPYCEKFKVPLGAIVYLGQAVENTIQPLTGFRAFRALWEGCAVETWDREDLDRATALVQQILESVPLYRLDCTPDETAVSTLEKALYGQEGL